MRFNKLTSEIVQANLNDIYIQVNSGMQMQGSNWYDIAHNYAKSFADEFELPLCLTAAIISCLSPQKQWYQNIKIAHEFLYSKGKKCRHVGKQAEKARCIYNLHFSDNEKCNIDWIEFYLGGQKTINFFHNIYEPENGNYCTIDSHMIQIMTGNMLCKIVTKKQYLFLKEELTKFANQHGFNVPVMQALLWVTFRIIKKS